MAALTTGGSGNWSSTTVNAPWAALTGSGTGGIPGAGDTVTIAAGHTVTLDSAACTANVLTIGSDPGGAVGSGTPALLIGTSAQTSSTNLIINTGLTLRLKGDLSMGCRDYGCRRPSA